MSKYGELLAEALQEAIDIKEGKARPARVDRVAISANDVSVAPPPNYDALRIRTIRRNLALSQTVFARLLNVSDSTVRAWEQGVRQPAGPTRRLLELAEERPDVVVSWVEERATA
jgi:DNA-binding transcriptional regulator YiaG